MQFTDILHLQKASTKGDKFLGRELARLLGVVLAEGAEQGTCDHAKYARELRGHLHFIASQEPRRLGSGGSALPSGSLETSHVTDFDLSQLKDVDASDSEDQKYLKEKAKPADEDGDVNDNLDVLSEVSDNSDLFHVSAVLSEEPRSEEDVDIRICRAIASHLRDFPLLPPDGRETEKA